jgi:hypothetical protein
MRNVALIATVVVGTQLGGCGDSTGAPAASAPAAGNTYEIVTVTKPESVEAHLKPERAMHQMCATLAQQKGVPVQPFPAVPAQYFIQRDTHVSDGRRYLSRTETYGLDPAPMLPEQGCLARFAIATSTTDRQGGKARHVTVGYDGQREEDEVAVHAPSSARADKAAAYSVAKTVAGHAVRCLPAGDPVLSTRLARELCVAASGTAFAADAEGDPIVVHFRGRNVFNTTDVIQEPQTLRLGGRIDPAAFGAAGRP